jgi:hypothetical protein
MAKPMTSRERFHATFHYGKPDRVWLQPQWTFDETRERWLREGMPRDQHFDTYWGYDRIETIPLRYGAWPPLERKVVEVGPGWQIVEDELGGRTKDWTDRDIGMPQWLIYPVRDRETWEAYKQRLAPDAPVRYPEYWDDYVKRVRDRDHPLVLHIGSYYGTLRNLVGMEHLALWYYDYPDLVHEMTEFIADFTLRLIDRALCDIPNTDCGNVWEDMGMKTGPLIGPGLFREFILEPLKRVTKAVNEAGIDLISVDSDGNNDVIVPLWLEAGVNYLYPLEIAADTDPVALRREHGHELRLAGGIDKRVLRDGCTKRDIEREVTSKVPGLVRDGGYSPWVDHAVPPDVPFANFRYYMDLIHEICTLS